ncbi:MaoC/PaaZ C-terminal domain-containing protein [Brevibacterium album]|uniref:MaoC/PaaZ C-terminal domain-containing protein n=1 Tax=Brevibacterium album TaxID=417948 RepID=UPI0004204D83|nr:MaoC/PaaZ C-terminal domain-containing protein [Brevibacterium album]
MSAQPTSAPGTTADPDTASGPGSRLGTASVPVSPSGRDSLPRRLPAEHMQVGVETAFGTHTVTADEILAFGRAWDPQYFHVDEAAAETSEFGGLIASGVHTLGIYQKLSVEAVLSRYDIVAGKEFTRLRFMRPVRPGDTLTGAMTVESLSPPRHGRCLGTAEGRLSNQDGKQVLDIEVEFLVRSAQCSGSTQVPGTAQSPGTTRVVPGTAQG